MTEVPEQERIVAAAIKSDASGIVYHVEAPGRHHNVIAIMPRVGEGPKRECGEQGFLTSSGRFVDRTEGLAIAKAANQIIRRCGGDSDELFSENLW